MYRGVLFSLQDSIACNRCGQEIDFQSTCIQGDRLELLRRRLNKVITDHKWCTYPKKFVVKKGCLSYFCDCMYQAQFNQHYGKFTCMEDSIHNITLGDEEDDYPDYESSVIDFGSLDMEWYTDDFRENNC